MTTNKNSTTSYFYMKIQFIVLLVTKEILIKLSTLLFQTFYSIININPFYKLQEIELVNVQIILMYLYIIALLRCLGTLLSIWAKDEAF